MVVFGGEISEPDKHRKQHRDYRNYPPADIQLFYDKAVAFSQILVIQNKVTAEKEKAQSHCETRIFKGNIAYKKRYICDDAVNIQPEPNVEKGLRYFIICDEEYHHKIRQRYREHHRIEKSGISIADYDIGIEGQAE